MGLRRRRRARQRQGAHPVCGGIAVHKDTLTAWRRRVDAPGQGRTEGRAFATTATSLLPLADGLVEPPCPVVALESPGGSWQPVAHGLVGTGEVSMGQAPERRSRPGKETDKRAAAWIADLLAQGLIQPRFVPPPELGAWREVTRPRGALVQTRSQRKTRVHQRLAAPPRKRGSVVSDLFGGTGRRLLAALVAGERPPQGLAALALGALQHQGAPWARALTGQCTAHPGPWRGLWRAGSEGLERQMATLAQESGALVAPWHAQLAPLARLPGVGSMAARERLAARGTEMSRLGDAARWAAWAGVGPGPPESAGNRSRGQTRPGNRSLRSLLVPGAWGARDTPPGWGRTLRRLAGRIGKTPAARANAHTLRVIVSHRLTLGPLYAEARAAQDHPSQEARERQRALKARARLGSTVTLARAA